MSILNNEEIKQILKCDFMEYNVMNDIITNIPQNIKKILFNNEFNSDIQPYLHSEITNIRFGYSFNQNVDNLPYELIYLTFGRLFNKPVNNLPLHKT
jgi:hypothetical protein